MIENRQWGSAQASASPFATHSQSPGGGRKRLRQLGRYRMSALLEVGGELILAQTKPVDSV